MPGFALSHSLASGCFGDRVSMTQTQAFPASPDPWIPVQSLNLRAKQLLPKACPASSGGPSSRSAAPAPATQPRSCAHTPDWAAAGVPARVVLPVPAEACGSIAPADRRRRLDPSGPDGPDGTAQLGAQLQRSTSRGCSEPPPRGCSPGRCAVQQQGAQRFTQGTRNANEASSGTCLSPDPES